MTPTRAVRLALYACEGLALVVSHLPLISVGFAGAIKSRCLTFPARRYAIGWSEDALQSPKVADLVATSLKVALNMTALSMVAGTFGALACARHQWRFRKIFQKLIVRRLALCAPAFLTRIRAASSPNTKTTQPSH